MRIYTWFISMLVKLNCQHACSLSLVWFGYGIEDLVMLE
jgi:putative component of membrane protein insertase Oxa1/YidC/SpoIIIJ protein YidD